MTGTARLNLPLIEPGQAQKELFHNEALLLLDAGVQAAAASVGTNAPPATAPVIGTCHLVGTAPTGEWAGHALAIAAWTAGGWRFVAPREGMAVWVESPAALMRFLGGDWRRGTAIPNPTGGTTIDAQARSAIGMILAMMRAHGLIVP